MRTYFVRPFGCQMNKHDGERVAGMLRENGYAPASRADDADVVVFLTCCVREGAEDRLRGTVSSLGRKPGRLIAVGGCIGQRDGIELQRRLPNADVIFGTHNLAHLPALLEAAETQRRPQVEVLEESTGFASDLPSERQHQWHAWVPIAKGCNNFCTYCIVPHVRGREHSRTIEDVVAEVASLADDGVLEVTLLGQNVNSYGRDLYGSPRFAELLRAVADTGIPRIRFATSHPKDLSEETIEALADTPAVMPYLHLPVQSGSDRVLAAMNRVYSQSDYLALIDRLRTRVPDLAISTDVIVGFPGETEEDFTETLRVVEHARFDHAFTFIYSPRTGTPAATFEGQVDRALAQERFDRLLERVQRFALEGSQRFVGTIQTVLIEGSSKRDPLMLTGRTPHNKVVHVLLPEGGDASSFAGRFVPVHIDETYTWFLSGSLAGTNSSESDG